MNVLKTGRKIDALQLDDTALLREIAAGNREALHVLFSRHHKSIFRFVARQTGSPSLADDIANDVFIEVWRVAATFQGKSKVSTWLFSIARFKALSVLRRKREDQLDEFSAEHLADDSDTPEISAQKTSKAAALRRAIGNLQEEHRTVIDLIYYHEKPVREVAEILSIPEATVKTRMFYARRKIGEALQAAGIDRGWP